MKVNVKMWTAVMVILCVGSAWAGITVVNPSFEEPGTGKQDLTNVPGWDAVSGTLGVENLGSPGQYAGAVTDGSYNLYAGDNSWASQLTSYAIIAGETYRLTVDVSNTWQGTEGATIELYYDDAGTAVSLGSMTYDFPNAASQEGPFELSLTVAADGMPAAVGNNLGIMLGTTNGWVGFDNVRLAVVPEPATMILLGLGSLLAVRKRK